MIVDLFDKRTDKQKLWEWMKECKLFSSVDLSKYNASNFTLRSGRTAREWCEGDNPRLRRLTNEQKLFKGLWNGKQANVAYYEVII